MARVNILWWDITDPEWWLKQQQMTEEQMLMIADRIKNKLWKKD